MEAYNRDNSTKLGVGYLLTMDNEIDPTTGTSKLKAVFENTDYSLFPSQFVNVKLLVDTKPNQIVIPSVAVQHGQQGSFVFLVGENSRVKLQPVQPGIVLDNDIPRSTADSKRAIRSSSTAPIVCRMAARYASVSPATMARAALVEDVVAAGWTLRGACRCSGGGRDGFRGDAAERIRYGRWASGQRQG